MKEQIPTKECFNEIKDWAERVIPKIRGQGYDAYYQKINTSLRSEVRKIIKEKVIIRIILNI